MTWLEIVVVVVFFALLVLPPKYDPAIRFKQWIEKKGPTK
jgi:hypothetical protein